MLAGAADANQILWFNANPIAGFLPHPKLLKASSTSFR